MRGGGFQVRVWGGWGVGCGVWGVGCGVWDLGGRNRGEGGGGTSPSMAQMIFRQSLVLVLGVWI